MGIIYKITSPSGRIYIGKSINLKKRVKDYKYCRKNRKSIVHGSIAKYGWDAHVLNIIEECDNEKLSDREIFWIKELNTYHLDNNNGMNMTRGGEAGGGSWMHDLERRKKQSEQVKGNRGHFYGKHHTEENKLHLSKLAIIRNKERGVRVPEWGAEKGRLAIIKAIILYNSDGDFVKEYESTNEASRRLNIIRQSITDSLLHGSWVSGKYMVKYKTENYPLKIEVGNIMTKNIKRPVLYLLNSYIIEYPSSFEASVDLNIPKTTISRAAYYNHLKPIRGGHIFIYKDIYESKVKAAS